MMIVMQLLVSMEQAIIPEDEARYIEALKKFGAEIHPDGPEKYELMTKAKISEALEFFGELGWDDTVIFTVSLPEHVED